MILNFLDRNFYLQYENNCKSDLEKNFSKAKKFFFINFDSKKRWKN